MAVERQPAVRPAGLDDGRADGEVRDEVAVHDVEVKQIGAGLDVPQLVGEPREVRGEKRWGDLDHAEAVRRREIELRISNFE